MTQMWVLTIVWVCHMSNAADCVGVYGPYTSLEACRAANPVNPGPSIETPIIGRSCKPMPDGISNPNRVFNP